MVFVLFHCRRYHEKASQTETVSHMFALKRMLLFGCTFTVVCYIKKIVLDYEDYLLCSGALYIAGRVK